MEQNQTSCCTRAGKRKLAEEDKLILDELNQDLLERVLSWLPPSSFFRLRSVCRKWSSVLSSSTFKIACSQVSFRDPWFFMVDRDFNQAIIFDTTEKSWRNLSFPAPLQEEEHGKPIPVASSGGIICFRTVSGKFIICNPVTGACRELPSAGPSCKTRIIHAIAMYLMSDKTSYKLVLVFGEFPHLLVKFFDSKENKWTCEFTLCQMQAQEPYFCGDETVYFLSKTGDIISTNMQRSPSKQYSSVIVAGGEKVITYFLSCSGMVVACDLVKHSFLEYPRLLPVYMEYSIDLVECGGEMMVVILSELLESASLRIWTFSDGDHTWHQLAAMPPAMSHAFYGKKADINCVGHGDQILVCVNSMESASYFLCHLTSNHWVELPGYSHNGKTKEFLSAFAFEPRIEACI